LKIVNLRMRIIGHQKIINYLDRSIEKDKISQAYLFCGPAHLGKFSLALEFARKITRLHPDNSWEALRVGGQEENQKINPDIIIISPETEEKDGKIKKKDIKIEKIRELQQMLSLSAYFGKYKVAIIDEAEKLTNASQNALLKTLEEPPQKTVIILITENADKIIPTVKSRCVIKKFGLAEKKEIVEILKNENDAKNLEFWALNRPGLAINFTKEKEEMEKRIKAQKDLKKMLEENLSEKFSFCEELSKDTSALVEELSFWTVILRENIFGNTEFFQLDRKKALKLILEIEKSLKIIKETNSNSRLVMENLALEM